MKQRTVDKIDMIERYLEELESFIPADFKEYISDKKTKAACERYFEKIIEGILDLSYLIIKDKNYKIPEDDKQAFDVLSEKNVITIQLAENLKNAKGMRNILAHQYGNVDDEIVFESISYELINDTKEFLKRIRQ